jgi:hypothetical protein
MPPLSKSWPLVFSILCLVLVAVDFFHHVSSTVIGLLALASAPWSLPRIAELIQTLKVGTVELNFRQHIEQKIDEGQKAVAAALSSGIGDPTLPSAVGPAPSGFSHSTSAAPDRGESFAPGTIEAPPDAEDANKNQFGGKPMASGRKLSAQVKPFPGSTQLFLIRASVASIDPSRPLVDDTPVTFYLHQSFNQKEIRKLVKNGAATIEIVSWGAFTMGAVVEEAENVPLELDLAKDVPDAPLAFVSR